MARPFVKVLILLSIMSFTGVAGAGIVVDRKGAAQQRCVPQDFLQHPDDSKYYTESWTTILHADDGRIIYINYMVTSIGVMEGRSAVSVSVSKPGGPFKHYGWDFDVDDFKAVSDGTIRVGRNSLSLKGKKLKINITASDLRLSANLNGWTGGVKFYDGTLWTSDSRKTWIKSFFHVPAGDFSGEMAIGKERGNIKGIGYSDHMVNNHLSSDYSDRWWTTRYFTKDYVLAFVSFRTTKKEGAAIGMRALVVDRNKVIFLTDRLKINGLNKAKDNKAGHQYDTVFDISHQGKGVSLVGKITGQGIHDREAVVEDLPWAQRNIAKMFAGNPVIYRQTGKVDLTLTVDGAEPVHLTEGTALMEAIVIDE